MTTRKDMKNSAGTDIMPEAINEQEGRSLFGHDPNNYDAIRPPYPEEIFEFLITRGALHPRTSTLEIGAGNGLATRRLLDYGADPLTVIEPDQRFSPLLRGILGSYPVESHLIVSSFEDAELSHGAYDLAVAATAFHWIRASSGLAKIAQALKPHGYVALWWNVFGDPNREDPFHEATKPILQNLSNSPSDPPNTLPFALDTDARVRDFSNTGIFEEPEYAAFRWTLLLNAQQVGSLYATFSSISRLPDDQRKVILEQLVKIAEREFGGSVRRNMVSPIYLARLKATSTY